MDTSSFCLLIGVWVFREILKLQIENFILIFRVFYILNYTTHMLHSKQKTYRLFLRPKSSEIPYCSLLHIPFPSCMPTQGRFTCLLVQLGKFYMLNLISFFCSESGSGEENIFIAIKPCILYLLHFFIYYFF